MLRAAAGRLLGPKGKLTLKASLNDARQRFIRTFLGYDGETLKQKLRSIGIAETDTLLVHSNFEPDSGFRGTPADLVACLIETVGRKGNLLMVSIPFRGTAYDHLAANKVFNVKKTFSMMGLVTEIFRRTPGTVRSFHPTHPVLAYGKDADWLIAGHESCLFPCGVGSPFEKFRELKGKILFFDVGLEAITFFHYVEDVLKDEMPFPVYDQRLFSVNAVDALGRQHVIQTFSFNPSITRRADKLRDQMQRQGKLRSSRIGNTRLLLATAEDVVTCQTDMVRERNYPYDV